MTLLLKINNKIQLKQSKKIIQLYLKNLDVEEKILGVNNAGWLQINIEGKDEKIAINYLKKEIGFCPSKKNNLEKNSIIKGKYPIQKIIKNNMQIGMITKKRGMISLTINGARVLTDLGRYWVKIYDDFTLKGSLFAPGIFDADNSIRIGDEVIIIKEKKLCAVGVAIMNGNEMRESSYGEAVRIRHRI